MGYEYTIHGWYKATGPVDLNAIETVGHGYDRAGHDHLGAYLRVTGQNRNYVLFATQAKYRGNYYLTALSALTASSVPGGMGLVAITGEWSYDGKDRFVLVRDRDLLAIPTVRLYDPLSPWNGVYRWSHYMTRSSETLVAPPVQLLRELLGGQTSVKGWLKLRDFKTSEADADRLIREIIEQYPHLAGGISFLNQNSEPYLLIGQDDVDTGSAVMALASFTGNHEETCGLIYSSGPDERLQIPVALEQGRMLVLPAVAIAPKTTAETEPGLLLTSADAYEGLGIGFNVLPIRSTMDLDALFRRLARVTDAQPAGPEDGLRQETGVSGPAYLFEARGLACILTTNEGQAHIDAHAGWPYLLIMYLSGPANPDVLQASVADMIALLQSTGIDVGADRLWPS